MGAASILTENFHHLTLGEEIAEAKGILMPDTIVSQAKLRSVATQMAADPEFAREVARDPIAAFGTPAYVGDRMVYRVVVFSLGAVAILALIGSIVLQYGGTAAQDQPPLLIAFGSAAIGALAGLLAPAPGSK